MNITEEQVIQWMHQQREKHGLSHLNLTVSRAIEPRSGHSGVPAYATFAAHTETQCKCGDTITEAVSKLTQ